MYLNEHDRADELGAAEVEYVDQLHEAQEGFCVSRGPEYRATIRELRATLAQKDAQIEALVDGILAVREWERDGETFCCAMCRETWPHHKKDCVRSMAKAIKEATNGS